MSVQAHCANVSLPVSQMRSRVHEARRVPRQRTPYLNDAAVRQGVSLCLPCREKENSLGYPRLSPSVQDTAFPNPSGMICGITRRTFYTS
jgi:hypothetical protein